jgi:hypothetical protein
MNRFRIDVIDALQRIASTSNRLLDIYAYDAYIP